MPRGKGPISVGSATSSSASSISSTDVIFQILLHLPSSKSVLACKSVSKQWYSIISDPQFLREKHRIQNGGRLKIPGLFLRKGSWNSADHDYICVDGNLSSTTAPFKTLNFAGEDRRILNSCNGLLLSTRRWDTAVMTYLKYYIYNPCTKQYKILPPFTRWPYISRDDMRYLSVSDIELAFDPLNSLHYKVICIWSLFNDPSAKKRIEIYSSETSSWRLCEKAYTFPDFHKSCVFWNGSLNWITNNASLVYFDIGHETVGQVLSPKDSRLWYSDSNCLNVYGGHLLFLLMNLDISTRFDVWEMDTNHTGWILKYKVDMEGLKASYPELGGCCNYTVLFIDEVEEFSPKFIVLIYDSNVIISYDSEENSCTILHDAHGWNTRWNIPSVYKYVESLACV